MKTYVESLVDFLKDKLVELYVGDQYEQVAYSDNTQNVSSVLVGKIVGGEGDCLIFDSLYRDKIDKKQKHGNIVYINGYNIRAACELNGSGSFRDSIVSVNDSPNFHLDGKHDK